MKDQFSIFRHPNSHIKTVQYREKECIGIFIENTLEMNGAILAPGKILSSLGAAWDELMAK